MSNQYPSNHEQNLPTTELRPGDELVIDGDAQAFRAEDLGFREEYDGRVRVFGSVDFRNSLGEVEGKAALIKAGNTAIGEFTYLVGLTRDQSGARIPMPRNNWMPLMESNAVALGREDEMDTKLFDRPFSNRVSRRQVGLTLENGNVKVSNLSRGNILNVDGRPLEEPTVDSWALQEAEPVVDWDKFHEAINSPDADEAAKTAVKGALLPPPTGRRYETPTIQETEENLSAKLDELKQQFSESDQTDLWRYAAFKMNADEMRQRGRQQEASNEGRISYESFNALSQRAREAAPEYLRLLKQTHIARKRLR